MNKPVKAVLSLFLALTILLSICVLPAMAYEVSGDNGLYVYIGDSMTFDFVGSHNHYLASTDIYPWQAARAMGYSTDDYGKFPGGRATDAYAAISDYPGDDYARTAMEKYITDPNADRFKQAVIDAKAISLQVGYSELTTFLLDNLTAYLETGELEYSCDLSQVFSPSELEKIMPFVAKSRDFIDILIPDDVQLAFSLFLSGLSALEKEALITLIGQTAFDLLSKINATADTLRDAFTYTIVSAIVHFDTLVARIYELNPDVDLYVMGLMNPLMPLRVGFDLSGIDFSISAGTLLDGFFDILNSYYRIYSPYSDQYYFVENVHHAEVYSEAMVKDEDLTRRILYALYNDGNRDGYETKKNAAAYAKAAAQAPGVMQMLENTSMVDLGKVISGLVEGSGSLDTSESAFEKLAVYDKNGNTTASYIEQFGAHIALVGILKGIYVHPTPAGHNAEAPLLIAAMQKKQINPLAILYHKLTPSLLYR